MYGSKNKSVMQHSFANIPQANIQRSTFKRDHAYKTTMESGIIYPILCDEYVPGDHFSVSLASVARLATPIYPLMDNMVMDFHFFAIPNRLIWDNFPKFMGQQDDPGDSTDYTVPQFTGFTNTSGMLHDYMGIPLGSTQKCNSLHARAYNLVWNQWYRDENLQPSVVVDKDDGPDYQGDYDLLPRGKRRDYFTSCLPWPQKGSDVTTPLGTTAPVIGDGNVVNFVVDTNNYNYGLHFNAGGNLDVGHDFAGESIPKNLSSGGTVPSSGDGLGLSQQSAYSGMIADLSSATAATINSLREAFQLQILLERDARGGTRYQELVLSHFKVLGDDSRLQRSEYLGGGSATIQITPIAQTSESNTTEQGKLAAVGYASQKGAGFSKAFVEHGVILGLCSIRADLTYQQGQDRMFSRQTKYDYYWPALANLGEQEVLNREIWQDGSANDDLVFGYQERWSEYRYKNSLITGLMRSDAAGSLDAWHLSQDFATLPALNADFIVESPPVSRVVAVPSEPEFIFDGFFRMRCTRPMPTYSVPGLIDHF